jgi:outer membrane immunogenic protein
MISRGLLVAVGVLGANSIAALAADMPLKAPPLAAPAFTWSGCYAGINGGGAQSMSRYELSPGGNYLNATGGAAPPNVAGSGDFPASIAALSHTYQPDSWGGLAGAQIGCNWQSGINVIGFEADGQWTDLKNSADAAFAAFANPGSPAFTNAAHTEHVSSKLEWLATFRARGGFAFDRVLIYVTGGVAVGGITSETNVSFATFPVNPVYNGAIHIGSDRFTRVGWVLGVGGEYAFAPRWSVKAEYLYIDLGEHTYFSPLVASAAPAAPGYAWKTVVSERDQVLRVGLNYKFF